MATKTTDTPKPEYNADALTSLDPITLIQKRPNIYLGTFERMQNVAIREPIDNSIDEFRVGHGKTVRITLFDDGSAQIEDSGRGVPTSVNKQTGENGIYMAFGKVGSGSKFGSANSGYAGEASLGLNGVGTTATNATSLRFDTIVYRDNRQYRLSFRNGRPGHFAKDGDPTSTFTPSMDIVESADPRSAKEKKERPSGTTIRFWPNPAIFGSESSYRVEDLRETLRSTAFLIGGIHIVLDDRSVKGAEQVDDFEFDGGLSEMIEFFAPDQKLHPTIRLEGEGSFTEKVPVPQADGITILEEVVERKVNVEAVLRWGNGYDHTVKSYVNTLYTPLNGTHVQGFERAMNKLLLGTIGGTRLLKAREENPTPDDIEEGLTLVLSINQPEPAFVGQDKQRLGGAATGRIVAEVVEREFAKWLGDRKNATVLREIQGKIVTAMRNRVAAREVKETARRKTALSSASMPAKLVDCSTKDTQFSELHIVEGNSAASSMKSARDSRYQALLPIRGKILNAYKASAADILKNAESAAIIQVVGAGSGKTFDIDQMRYARIVITADADVDGNHIRTLLMALFWKEMRPLVEAGRLYASVPPLYSIKTNGKNSETIYILDDSELQPVLDRLKREKKSHGPVGRFKGLGEMDPPELRDTTLDPRKRVLRQITVDDVKAAENMLELAMSDAVPPRKEWIEDYRSLIDDDMLDL